MAKVKKNTRLFIRHINNYVSFFVLFILSTISLAQQSSTYSLAWGVVDDPVLKTKLFTFDKACLVSEGEITPIFSIEIDGGVVQDVFVDQTVYEPISSVEEKYINKNIVRQDLDIKVNKGKLKKKPFNVISFYPIVKDEQGNYRKLVSFRLNYTKSNVNAEKRAGSRSYADHSIFAQNDWYKFGVVKDGVYKITYTQLMSLGIPINNIDPRNIALYGSGGGMLPYDNSIERPDDIQECAIKIMGEEDGSFDEQDYILFYGEGQDRWNYSGQTYLRTRNIFSDTTYYFLRLGATSGKRIQSVNSSTSIATHTVTTFDEHKYYEYDRVNMIKSGSRWFGEAFEVNASQNFEFEFKNLDISEPLTIRSKFAASSIGNASSYTLSAGSASQTYVISATSGSYAAIVAYETSGEIETIVSSETFDVNITFNKANSSANGWLDHIEVIGTRKLETTGDQLIYRDATSAGLGNVAKYQISNASSNYYVWNVTDNNEVFDINYTLSSGTINYNFASDNIEEYVAFTDDQVLTPFYSKKIINQDLHGFATAFPDYIIISHPLFLSSANTLAQFHETNDGLSTLVVTTDQIFNEFSSGAQDITAIKDFIKMFYDQAGTDTAKFPKYVLLFGDGSYDYKNLKPGNTNFVPVYQSANSFDPIGSYASDDYFGLLDDTEADNVSDIIDVGIGRLPVQTVEQANDMVNKIKSYYDTGSMRSWRNRIVFVGDDEDNNLHMSQADDLADKVATYNPEMNVDKIYLDAYPQVSGAGGNRYPEAADDIDRAVDKGALLVNYVGHGGELGWSHERVLENSTINNWDNIESMPVFLTATCEFSRFDDPERVSAGEYVLLNSNGGGVALLTTTRLVFSHLNKSLMDAFYDNGFNNVKNGIDRLGDLVMVTKQFGPKAVNTRNFSLLGDPALKLAYPKHNVISVNVPDSIKALSKVTITGKVIDENGQTLTGFNGVVYPTVFDKSKLMTTLNNDGVGVFNYNLQKNILFKGKASVTNGEFSFSFVAPKDINFSFGNGRISYYAENGFEDASGYDASIIIGGFDNEAETDNQGPVVELYMNDESFVYGGTTNESPLLIAKLSDENGINTTGNGVGHDITGVLDENTMETIELNDFYEAGLNDYTQGEVRYQLSELSEGTHKIYVKAWDVYNNSGDNYTEFIVASSSELALSHVLNYPNPFTTNTAFYFEHNQPGNSLDISIQIFTVSGKVVKTLNAYVLGDQIRVGPINWDGKDDYGDNIGKGVYVYKVSVKNDQGEQVDKYEKLVLLK